MSVAAPVASSATRSGSGAASTSASRRLFWAILPLLCCLLLLSGAAGLIYQVAWVRILGLSFGVTVHAISTVLAAFMGGLAIGSLVGGRLADRVKRPLLVYAIFEIAIALTALATPAGFTLLQNLYRDLSGVIDPHQAPLVAGAVRAVMAFALLMIPTGLMGTTLPLAVRAVRRAREVSRDTEVSRDSRAMGFLYAMNTTGAILGTVGAGFVLIGGIGIQNTILFAAVCNGIAGVGALVLVALGFAGGVEETAPPPAPAVTTAKPVEQADVPSRRLAMAAFWTFGISGGLSLAYEVVWSRVLAVLFDTSIYGFVVMLGTVLFGLAVGSVIAGAAVQWRTSVKFAGLTFGWVEIGIGVTAIASLVAFGFIHDLLLGWQAMGGPIFGRLLRTELRLMVTLCILTVLPSALLMGATFPLAARLWAAGETSLGQRLGGIYAANTVGAILGSLAGGFLLVPVLGAQNSMLLLAAGNVLVGAWLLVVSVKRPATAVIGLVVGAAVIALAAPRPPVHELVFNQRFGDQQLLWYREGLENTVSVGKNEQGIVRLYTNSRSQTTDAPDLVRYHRIMGHLAAVLSPREERRVLVVGVGGGATPGAIAQHTGTHIDLVELSEAVVAAAPFFQVANSNLLSRPNVTLTIDDGRNWLLRNRQPYDIIAADIVPPFDAGATNLYSVEYFRLAAKALAPDGLMIQWVSPESKFAYDVVTRTFLEAFPHSTLWLTGDLLIGSPNPIQIDEAKLAQQLANTTAREGLAEVGFLKPQDVLSQFKATEQELAAYVKEGPILSDDRPLLEYFYSSDVTFEAPDLSHFSGDWSKILRR